MSAANEKHTCTGWKGSLGCSACNRGVPAPTRRLIGWRVRYEWRASPRWSPPGRRKWSALCDMLRALPDARRVARELRVDSECRNVRIMRVYRRSKR